MKNRMKNRMKTQGLQTLPRELSRSLRVQKRSQWLLFVIVSLIVVSFLSTLQICMKLHALLPPFPKNDTNALISHGQHRSSAVPDGPRWSSMVLSGSEASCRQSHLYLATASRMHCIDIVLDVSVCQLFRVAMQHWIMYWIYLIET
jgi:hypothetical protein